MKFFRNLAERRERKRLRAMDKLERVSEKIRMRYPRYSVGVGSYGVPEVTEFGEESVLRIGSYSSIAAGVQILLGGEHRTDWVSSYPFPAMVEGLEDITDYDRSKGDVVIGSDCWICTNAVILSGVTIGHGAIVAAGAMVTRDVPPFAVVGGNPCKFIRWRFDEPVREALLEAAWWDWPMEEVKQVARMLSSADLDAFLGYARARQGR